jgi:hypothetical protein
MAPRLEAVSQWTSALGVPVLLALAAIAVPYMISDANWSGRMEEKLGGIQTDLGRVEQGLGARIEAMDKGLQSRFDTLDRNLQAVSGRVRETETDPFALIAKAGYEVGRDVVAGTVDGTLVLFPKTEAIKATLSSAGFERTQVTPFLEGFTRKTVSPPAQ